VITNAATVENSDPATVPISAPLMPLPLITSGTETAIDTSGRAADDHRECHRASFHPDDVGGEAKIEPEAPEAIISRT